MHVKFSKRTNALGYQKSKFSYTKNKKIEIETLFELKSIPFAYLVRSWFDANSKI